MTAFNSTRLNLFRRQIGWGLLLVGGLGCMSTTSNGTRRGSPGRDAGAPRSSGVREFQQAEGLRRSGKPQDAISSYLAAAGLAGESGHRSLEVESWVRAGECQMLAGEEKEAWHSFSKALERAEALPPGDIVARTARMWAHTGLGDIDLAASRITNAAVHYEQAAKVAQGAARDPLCYRQMLIEEARGNSAKARSLRAEIRNPDDPRLMSLRVRFQKSLAAMRKPPPSPVGLFEGSSLLLQARSTWDAAAPRLNDIDPMTKVWRVTVHHTADEVNGSARGDTADAIHRMQRYHMSQNGWADIGYHFLIDSKGRIWQGRLLDYQGAHAGSGELNGGNIGIVLLGDFTATPPSSTQQKSLFQLLSLIEQRLGVSRAHFYTHRELKTTSCPGPIIQRLIDRFRRSHGAEAG